MDVYNYAKSLFKLSFGVIHSKKESLFTCNVVEVIVVI